MKKSISEPVRTLLFVAAAVVLAGVAWLAQPSPSEVEQFSEQGGLFYPDFTDPLAAASLEVIEFNEESGAARPFKVQVTDGKWTIPSHYDYPADGESRLAETAAAMIDLRKDIIQSDRAQDHEALGVVDPLDEATASLAGRGTRVTLRDESGSVLADYIIGEPVEGKEAFRYVRIPDKKRTYAVSVNVDLSTSFADWIETDLLDLQANEIRQVTIRDYSIDESTGAINTQGEVELAKGDQGTWRLEGEDVPPGKELDVGKVNQMTSALSRLTITGVRPKPPSLTADLQAKEGLRVDLPAQISLQSKGFFVSRDGRLLSNEGEVSIGTDDGVRYTLRFGEVLYGEGLDVSAGDGEDEAKSESEGEGESEGDATGEPGQDEAAAPGPENRYLFVTAQFDEALLPPKPQQPTDDPSRVGRAERSPPLGDDQRQNAPADQETSDQETADQETPNQESPPPSPDLTEYEAELAEWEAEVEQGRAAAERLTARFAPWYYVISAADFSRIRLNLDKLLKDKPEPAPSDETD